MRATRAVAVVAISASMTACGGHGERVRRSGPERQVADTISALQRDLAAHDWTGVCERVFSASARAQAGGARCPDFVRSGAEGVSSPRIEVRSISVRGAQATADVITRAADQADVRETVRLVLENGSYRITQLGP